MRRFYFACVFASLGLLAFLQASPVPPVKVLKITERNAKLLNHIGDYPDLEVLSIQCLEELKVLPETIGSLSKLRELTMNNGNGCEMNPVLPPNIGNLQSLKKLDLYGAQSPGVNKRDHQPKEQHKFPESMSQLKNLEYLDLGGNGLVEIPSFVQDLSNLKEFHFQWNQLRTIPPFVTNLSNVTTLRLEGNDLSDLPDSLHALPKLAGVTLGNNCKITQSKAKMDGLKRRFPKITFDFEDEYDCPESQAK